MTGTPSAGAPAPRRHAEPAPRPRRLRRLLFGGRRRDCDRGGPILEFAAVLPILLLTVVVAIEAFLAFVAIERIESAARAGARTAGTQQLEGAESAAREALPGWLDDAAVTSGANDSDGYYVEVSHPLPIVFSSVDLNLTLTRRVDMPNV